MKMPGYIETIQLASGKVMLTITHPKTHCPMMQFLMEPGSGAVARRAIIAYHNGDGDADAYFHAQGMSDDEAFSKGTWS